ncbi:hypothetical protein Pfo_004276 [Paulownia fortunei]|nr:hypothetical protein Pfo_004276 [Paulownia fortunei]
MKALSKPISSPSRAEKFPPPLMRFLRSSVGSRSRGRSRSSPMFYMRSKRNAAGVIETTQEPSSPKVTCIGQVRASRSAKSKAKKAGGASVNRHPCWLLKTTLFSGKFSSIFHSQKRAFRRIFCKWGLFLKSDYCKKVDATEDSFRVYSNQKSEKTENLVGGNDRNSSSSISESEFYSRKCENLGARAQESKREILDDSSPPPKNALILPRCRSAPYRSSSLGGRFWGSPLAEKGGDNETENDAKSEELQNPSCENPVEESRISQESSKELENSVNNVQDSKGIAGGAVHPLLLTRCKSEPARIGERLIPEPNFWRQRRFGAVEPSSLTTYRNC